MSTLARAILFLVLAPQASLILNSQRMLVGNILHQSILWSTWMEQLVLDVFVPPRPHCPAIGRTDPGWRIHFAGLLSWLAERCRAQTRLRQRSWLSVVPEHNHHIRNNPACLPIGLFRPRPREGYWRGGFCSSFEGMVMLQFTIHQHPAAKS